MDKMEPSTSSCYSKTEFSVEEMEVAQILLHLQSPIFESASLLRFPFSWGTKKRRSAINLKPPPHPIDNKPEAKSNTSSPTTPLSFSPSESDLKSKQSKREKTTEMRKEELLEILADSTRRHENLIREVENVKRYYEKLKSLNVALEAKSQELGASERAPESYATVKVEEDRQDSTVVHQAACMVDQTAYDMVVSLPSSRSGLLVPSLGPHGIPDLNVALKEFVVGVESFQPMDVCKMMAAQARSRRILINTGDFQPMDASKIMAAEARRRRLLIKRRKNLLAAK